MTSSKMSFLNIVPTARVKKERVEDDEDIILCKFCAKGFANTTALTNHARVEHFDEYVTGEDLALDPTPKTSGVSKKTKSQQREETKQQIQLKTAQLISSMAPINLTSFASPEVSYIIIKDDTTLQPEMKRRKEKAKRERDSKPEGGREQKVLPIAGPFECLHPSNLGEGGACHQMFFSCCEYSAHYRDEHTRRRKGLRCQVCEKPLCGDGEMPHTCETCGSGFQTRTELSEHIATAHVKLKPYQCNICLKRFTQQGGLQLHMRMHTGDRPFNCTFCPKSFTQKSGLEQHLRIHTKVRPYRCVICSKNFCQSVHLKQHMRTHTNVSPFECAICQKRFKQSSHLNYHLKCHNPANLTEDQKEKYKELLGLIGRDDDGRTVQYETQYEQERELEMLEVYDDEQDDGEVLEENVLEEYILGDAAVSE